MMIKNNIKIFLSVIGLAFAISSCTDKWDQHIEITDDITKNNIYEEISTKSELSEFTKLLKSSGYDEILAGSKSYTVFAPTNQAMGNIDPSILNNEESVAKFISNHIALSVYKTTSTSDTIGLKMLSGKVLDLLNNTISNVGISEPNKYSSNGVYHVINEVLTPKQSIWDYILSSGNLYAQNNFVQELSNIHIYPNNIDDTGEEDLDNEFLYEAYNVKNENRKFTYFVMQNSLFESEFGRLLPYLNRPGVDTTEYLAKHFAVKDLIFSGAYKLNDLPDTLISRFGVKIPVPKNNIVETISLSNGYVHVISNLNLSLEDKLITRVIEGEFPDVFVPNDKRANTFYRLKRDPNGLDFRDVMVQNHGVSLFEIGYRTPVLFSTKYKVYWRAINDIQANVFQQRLRIGGVRDLNGIVQNTIMLFPYVNVPVNDFNEIFIGEFTLTNAGDIPLALIGNNVTTNGNNTLTLDYIKLVPVIK
jgi:hypothetical protein